ncbi:hypothetical protein VNO77_19233 [Canavalia gladiata]|uniref:Uncharacterized protein n=1 Tax=Canavalia gladiata TaxID=3824 RepID=A0AAN9QKB3_CANGL
MDIAMRGSSSLVPSPSSVPIPATGLVRRFQPWLSRHRPCFRFQSLPVPAHACSARHRPEPSNSAHRASSPLFCIVDASIERWLGQMRSSRHRQPLCRVVPGLRPQHPTSRERSPNDGDGGFPARAAIVFSSTAGIRGQAAERYSPCASSLTGLCLI